LSLATEVFGLNSQTTFLNFQIRVGRLLTDLDNCEDARNELMVAKGVSKLISIIIDLLFELNCIVVHFNLLKIASRN
jgi:hypothetical protein